MLLLDTVHKATKYVLVFALYGHSRSIGQSKQRVASPAAGGFAAFLKCWRDPNDDTRVGVAGDNQLHMISMSLYIVGLATIDTASERKYSTGSFLSSKRSSYPSLLTSSLEHMSEQSDSSQ